MPAIVTVYYIGNQSPSPQPFSVSSWEVHTYGFLELVIGTSRFFINLATVASFTVAPAPPPIPVPTA